jgi:hypothetical protein
MGFSAFFIVVLVDGFVKGFSISVLSLLVELSHQLLKLLLELVGLILQVLVQELGF